MPHFRPLHAPIAGMRNDSAESAVGWKGRGAHVYVVFASEGNNYILARFLRHVGPPEGEKGPTNQRQCIVRLISFSHILGDYFNRVTQLLSHGEMEEAVLCMADGEREAGVAMEPCPAS